MCFADRFFFLGGGAHAFLEPQVRLLRITKRDVDLKTSIKMATDTSITDPRGGGFAKYIWNTARWRYFDLRETA